MCTLVEKSPMHAFTDSEKLIFSRFFLLSSPASRQFSAMLAAAASSVPKPQVVTKTLTEYVGPRVASVDQDKPERQEKSHSKSDVASTKSTAAPAPAASSQASASYSHSSSMLPGMPIAQQALGKS